MQLLRAVAAGLAAVAVAAPIASADPPVHVYLTTPYGEKQLERQPDARFTKNASAAPLTVDLKPDERYQRIRGFGASLTDSSTWLLSKLPAPKRKAVLQKLFDPKTGADFNVVRVPMGASDFTASGPYSYDDMPPGQTDPTLAHFSIDHDRAYVIPVIREALAINPKIQIVANPWSPPAWMKTNDSMFATPPGGLPGRLKPEAYGPLAQYFVRFIEAYRAAGIPIWAVTPQNEPTQPTADYPGMLMSANEEATFVRDYLAPALRAAHLDDVRIFGYDYVYLTSEAYIPPLMDGAAGDIDGLAFHCYFGQPESMSTAHSLYPGKEIIEDECSTGISKLSPIQVLVRSVNNWASTVQMWNFALDPAGGPKIGSGCLSCIGVTRVDPATGEVAYTGNYFQLAHASRFVKRGAVRIGAATAPPQPSCQDFVVCGLEVAAFRNPDGSTVVVATNSGPATSFALRQPDGSSLTYSLPAQQPPRNGTDNSEDAAIATFVWGGERPKPRLALSTRCERHGLRARVRGRDIKKVKRVAFYAGRKRVATDRKRPFIKRIARKRFRKSHRWQVRARASLKDSRSTTLTHTKRRCR